MSGASDDLRERLRAEIAAIEGRNPSRLVPVASSRVARGGRIGTGGALDCPQDATDEVLEPDAPPKGRATDSDAAFRKIERLAGAREQASAALRRRLAREGFAPEAVEEALAHALSCGLVDDARYADVLARSRLAQGRGRQGIAAELSGLGIDPNGVDALADADEGAPDEVERARALLERRPPRAKNQRDAAYRRLVQKGFGADAAASAARMWSESRKG